MRFYDQCEPDPEFRKLCQDTHVFAIEKANLINTPGLGFFDESPRGGRFSCEDNFYVQGVFSQDENKIYINRTLGPQGATKTVFHEDAHAYESESDSPLTPEALHQKVESWAEREAPAGGKTIAEARANVLQALAEYLIQHERWLFAGDVARELARFRPNKAANFLQQIAEGEAHWVDFGISRIERLYRAERERDRLRRYNARDREQLKFQADRERISHLAEDGLVAARRAADRVEKNRVRLFQEQVKKVSEGKGAFWPEGFVELRKTPTPDYIWRPSTSKETHKEKKRRDDDTENNPSPLRWTTPGIWARK